MSEEAEGPHTGPPRPLPPFPSPSWLCWVGGYWRAMALSHPLVSFLHVCPPVPLTTLQGV